MGETEEDKLYTLSTAGAMLTFDSAEVLAMMGFTTVELFRGDSVITGTESQEFNFHTLTSLCLANDIVKDTLFTMQDDGYLYNFKLSNNPISQLDGWSRFPALLINKEEL